MPQRAEDLRLERITDTVSIVGARTEQLYQTEPVLIEGAAKEGVEIQERGWIVVLRERDEIDLVEAIELMGAVFVVQPPQPPVRQNAPVEAGVLDIERDLVRRVLVGERIAALPLRPSQYLVEWAVLVFRIADR